VGALSAEAEQFLQDMLCQNPKFFRRLDKSVLMAVAASALAFESSGWAKEKIKRQAIGVNIGSSRGATGLFEKFHAEFLRSPENRAALLTSPLTTLGNISSSVANYLDLHGPVISNSMTCTTGAQAVINGVAWLKAGMADRFLAGGSEAPLTSFTLAQLEALGICAHDTDDLYPCRPLSSAEKTADMMILGEGAAVFALEKRTKAELAEGKTEAIIESVGYAFEKISSPTGISEEANALQQSMQMALKNQQNETPVDLVLMHAPGTVMGDRAELRAISKVFGGQMPNLFSNKWKIGHTYAASAPLSMELAILAIQNQLDLDFPYPNRVHNTKRPIKKVMVNSAGFGGNATSIILSASNL
jgi:3-oxoacyl-[acyl-carrier-protein] synthase II